MKPWLLADIGGTQARFALMADRRIGEIQSLSTGAYAEPIDAIHHVLKGRPAGDLAGAVIAAAGPVDAGRCQLTNASWLIDGPAIAQALRVPDVLVVNDLQGLGWAVPQFSGADLAAIGGGHERAGEPVALIAPGTGLGIACYVSAGDHAHVLATEGGHATWAPEDAEEEAVLDVLRRRFGHVSIERVVSGGGMVAVHEALCELAGLPRPDWTPGEIAAAAQAGTADGVAAMAQRTVAMFCAALGAAAGNLALTFGARGGVLIGGGIPPRLLDALRRSAFRQRFESKGRMSSYTRPISTRVIVHADPTFVGLAALARRSGDRAR